ncbi:hypothetical protein B0H13DRAFT_1936731 [Mycena leptocephala]|nr:hypothetical protein B0H13DRAFT_1936731 [Mycena leptocephala]
MALHWPPKTKRSTISALAVRGAPDRPTQSVTGNRSPSHRLPLTGPPTQHGTKSVIKPATYANPSNQPGHMLLIPLTGEAQQARLKLACVNTAAVTSTATLFWPSMWLLVGDKNTVTLVLTTWSGTLDNEQNLPANWLREPRVLVGSCAFLRTHPRRRSRGIG